MSSSTTMREYLRAHVLGLVAIFIALTGTAIAGSDGPTASSSAVTDAKFKKLKKRVGALEGTLGASARGDLTGIYPNLQIAPNSVTGVELADNSVNTAKLQDNAVSSAKLATDSVGTRELKPITVRSGTTTGVNDGNGSGPLAANCVAGEQAFPAAGFWSDFSAGTTSDGLAVGDITNGFGGAHTTLIGASNQSGANHNFTPQVFCLAP